MEDLKALFSSVFPAGLQDQGYLERHWREARGTFPGKTLSKWLDACRDLSASDLSASCALIYLRNGPACARIVGPEAVIEMANTGTVLGKISGNRAALALFSVALAAARQLKEAFSFLSWLKVVERLAAVAPESLPVLLDRVEGLLGEMDVAGFEAWALAGVRSAGRDPQRRLNFFTLDDPNAKRWMQREGKDVTFPHVRRRLRAYLIALWNLQASLRPPPDSGNEAVPRRTSFDGTLIFVPEAFRGFEGQRAADLFRASLAHVAAHIVFTRGKFPVGTLKPVQVALVSLIEDARVEQLVIRDFPGMRRLWLPFHEASASGGLVAPVLMARLSRALIDPDYRDDDPWVRKGRGMFFDSKGEWDNPAISRTIGDLLGNDIGQMRVQFNSRAYQVEPPYRDDNQGLWDFGDQEQAQFEEAVAVESVRLERRETDTPPPDNKRDPDDPAPPEDPQVGRARLEMAELDENGIPVARYPEWDYAIGFDRPEWTTVHECPIRAANPGIIDRILEDHPVILHRVTSLIHSAKVGRPLRVRRQPEGDHLDLDACIQVKVNWRMGETPDSRIYVSSIRQHRDLSVLLLLDISESTNDLVPGNGSSVLALERQATAFIAHAMVGLRDPFAIHAFCSNGREKVNYFSIKDFDAPYDDGAKSRLAGLSAGLSTRIGAALRHAGSKLSLRLTHRRLLLVITDGEPFDIDVNDQRYLVEDARKAVMGLRQAGIDVFCVGLETGGDNYLQKVFGRRNYLLIDRVDRLPEKLPMLYFRLTA